MTPRLFSVSAFRFSLPADPSTAVGKWSRGATFGKKVQDGVEMDFTPEFLGRMVDFVAARGNELSICQDHKSIYVATTGQPAPSLGFFHGLAVFDNGKLVKHWAFDGAAPPPGTDENGTPRDGLYCRLGRLTPLGLDPLQGLANYSSLSPCFKQDAAHEDGSPAKVALYDFAATSMPFQAATPIVFHGGPEKLITMARDGEGSPLSVGDAVYAGGSRGVVSSISGTKITVSFPGGKTSSWDEDDREVLKIRERAFGASEKTTTMANPTRADLEAGIRGDEETKRKMEAAIPYLERGEKAPGEPNLSLDNARRTLRAVEQTIANKRAALARMSATPGARRRFSQGAATMDPTQMAAHFGWTPEDDDKAKLDKVMAKMAEAPAEPFAGKETPEEEKAEEEAKKAMSALVGAPVANFRSLSVHVNAGKLVPVSEVTQLRTEIQTMSAQLTSARDEKVAEVAGAYVAQQIADGRADAKAKDALVRTFSAAAIAAHKPGADRAAIDKAGVDAVEPFLLAKGTLTLGTRITANGNPIGKTEKPPTDLAQADPDEVQAAFVAKANEIKARDKVTFAIAADKVRAEAPEIFAAYRALRR